VDLDALKALLTAGTPLPWVVLRDVDEMWMQIRSEAPDLAWEYQRQIATVHTPDEEWPDFDLVVAAVNGLPALLAEVDRLTALVGRGSDLADANDQLGQALTATQAELEQQRRRADGLSQLRKLADDNLQTAYRKSAEATGEAKRLRELLADVGQGHQERTAALAAERDEAIRLADVRADRIDELEADAHDHAKEFADLIAEREAAVARVAALETDRAEEREQWGVRYADGNVRPFSSANAARVSANKSRARGFDVEVVRRLTYPWLPVATVVQEPASEETVCPTCGTTWEADIDTCPTCQDAGRTKA
jgi:hypothetical protein